MARPRSFDEDTLLDAAIELFWTNGYRATSLAQLSERTLVANGSLYQAYGKKWTLFLAAYRRYCTRRVALVSGVFDTDHGGVATTVTAFFDAIVDDCLSHEDRRGCLMLNTISEFGTDSEIARISGETVDAMEREVAVALANAASAAASADEISQSAAHIVALSQALIQLSRVGRDPLELRRIGNHAAASTERILLAA